MFTQQGLILMSDKHTAGLLKSLFHAASRSTRLLILCAVISLVFGLWGWFAARASLGLNIGDVVYRAIAALSLSVPYQSSVTWHGDWRIEVARWFGMLALLIGAGKTVFLLLERHWVRKIAERRHGHWMVVGSSPFAKRLGQAAVQQGRIVHWLVASEHSKNYKNNPLFIDDSPWGLQLAQSLGLGRARGAVVAMEDDATTYAVAREIRKAIPDQNQLTVMASIRSPWLAMRVDEIEGVQGIRIFSEAQIAVRRLQRRNPPFLIAEHLRHQQLHTVICDFSEYGEAVLIETLLSSFTLGLQKPVFTIVDPSANSIRNDLKIRFPELERSCVLQFVEGRLTGPEGVLAPSDITQALHSVPVSVFYSCHMNDEVSLTSALALQALSFNASMDGAPVFARQYSSATLPMASSGAAGLQTSQLVAFGALDELASETGLFSNQADQLAKAFHKHYLSVSPSDKPAHKPWEELSEDLRDANRRLVVHIPAKLHSLGMDLEKWIEKTEDKAGSVQLPVLNNVDISTDTMERMAVLEHERWMADRRVNGWVYGSERDNARRIHPDLVVFDQLSEQSKSYDREMISSLLQICQRAKV